MIVDSSGQVCAQLWGGIHGSNDCPTGKRGAIITTYDPPEQEMGKYRKMYRSRIGLVTPMHRIIEAIDMMTAPIDPDTAHPITGKGAVLKVPRRKLRKSSQIRYERLE